MKKHKKQAASEPSAKKNLLSQAVEKAEHYSRLFAAKTGSSMVRRWVELFFHPYESMAQEQARASLSEGVVLVLAAAVLQSAVSFIVYSIQSAFFSSFTPSAPSAPSLLNSVIAVPLGLLVWIVFSSATHVLARLLGGRGDFGKLAFVYAVALGSSSLFYSISLVLSVVPVVCIAGYALQLVVTFYGLYLYYAGVRSVHGLSKAKSAAAFLLGFLAATAFSIFATMLAFSALGAPLLPAATASP